MILTVDGGRVHASIFIFILSSLFLGSWVSFGSFLGQRDDVGFALQNNRTFD